MRYDGALLMISHSTERLFVRFVVIKMLKVTLLKVEGCLVRAKLNQACLLLETLFDANADSILGSI